MILVKLAIGLTKTATNFKMSRAESRNKKALKRLKKSRNAVHATTVGLAATQVNIVSQLSHLTKAQCEVAQKIGVTQKKFKALEQAVDIVS